MPLGYTFGWKNPASNLHCMGTRKWLQRHCTFHVGELKPLLLATASQHVITGMHSACLGRPSWVVLAEFHRQGVVTALPAAGTSQQFVMAAGHATQQSTACGSPSIRVRKDSDISAQHIVYWVTSHEVLLIACALHTNQSVPCLPGIKHFHLIRSIVLQAGHNDTSVSASLSACSKHMCIDEEDSVSGERHSPVRLCFWAGMEAERLVLAP